ncbi:MAG TPA: hypothetical protein VLE22_04560, partial [Bryobacteraceae bacterium]|nr:hypothetical protein [Bryobacteraceae bacterium]
LFHASADGASADTYLPWEGGPAYYRKWSNGVSADPGYFPISVWLQDPKYAQEYRAIGINLYVGLWRGPNDEQLAALAAAGMPVLAGQRKPAMASLNSRMIRGWTIGDEPDNAQSKPGGGYGPCIFPPAIVDQYRGIQSADATRPVYLNLGQGVANDAYVGRGVCRGHSEHYAEYIRGADIVSYDVYPVNSKYPLWWVGEGVERLRRWGEHKKPVWNWIEASAIQGERKPSPAQIRSEVWMSIIHGSMGIGYFCHQFKPVQDEAAPLHDPETRQALADINGQIASLARVLNTPPVGNGVTVASSNPDSPIDVMLKRQGGKTYLFAMGARPGGETTARFKLRDCGDVRATVLGESRTIPVTGGIFEDRFADYQVHLYELPFDPGAR